MSKISIDFVSDVACPWCALGLAGLLAAVARVKDVAEVELRMQPFELNPDMPPGGENTVERLMQKYGRDREQVRATRRMIAERAAAAGVPMRMSDEDRSYNTFDAHRLVAWAAQQGQDRQIALARRLFETYHFENRDTADHAVLVQAAAAAGLDADAASRVLASDQYAQAVRAEQAKWRQLGIGSVPSIILNDEYLVSGAQPVEVFEQSLRQLAGGAAG